MEIHHKKNAKPRVVIVGAGFAGVSVARALKNTSVEVRLIDQFNYHTFQPLLYQVATAGLEPESIAHAVRGIFHKQTNVDFILGKVVSADKVAKTVLLEDGTKVDYDYLVLAAGATTNFFGIDGVADHALTLKSIDDALKVRSHVLSRFEEANTNPALIEKGWLNFVVVGGGPTGVEMAGSLHELFTHVLRKDFPHLPIEQAKVFLVEATPNILAPFKPELRAYTVNRLNNQGIKVLLDTKVIKATADAVYFHTGDVIPTQTLIWAAGIRVAPLADAMGLPQAQAGRIVVNPDLSVPEYPEIFVAGDMAASKDKDGKIHPQLAPNAMQTGKFVAKRIQNLILNRPFDEVYHYFDKGIMATIGRNAAVAQTPWGMKMRGFFAWMAWLFLHLMYLVGFRNRTQVFFDWMWNYMTYDRSARMIFKK